MRVETNAEEMMYGRCGDSDSELYYVLVSLVVSKRIKVGIWTQTLLLNKSQDSDNSHLTMTMIRVM